MPTVVDVHNHIIPPGFISRVREEGARYGVTISTGDDGNETLTMPSGPSVRLPSREVTVARGTSTRMNPAVRRKEMQAAGIDVEVQSIAPTFMSYGANSELARWIAGALNDSLAELMIADPQHVIAMSTVPLQFPELAIDELRRVNSEFGISSVQIGTHVGKMDLDDPALAPFWAEVDALGFLVLIHPHQQNPIGKDRFEDYHLHNLIAHPLETAIAAARLIFGAVYDSHPNLKICFAHGGGLAPWLRGRWRHGYSSRSETHSRGVSKPFDEYFSKIYVDTITHDPTALRFLIDTLGAEHVLFGTDYPASMGDWHQAETIKNLDGISERNKSEILGSNALSLLLNPRAAVAHPQAEAS